MKIAIVFNRESKNVINLFGIPNRERYGKKSIKRITDGLKQYGHQVTALEGDKDLIRNLEAFMPRVVKGERPGMVFNLSYGIQGQARYTHVPGILEMIGIPYVGSGPLAHSLALDKVVAKMIFRQRGLPTPDFAVLDEPGFDAPELTYPLIVKPKNEAVSMGIKIVNNLEELRSAAQYIFDTFQQPVLVEQYIDGREINVGLIGNNPPTALPPCEIVFGGEGPPIYTIEDKKGKSGRQIDWICPADIGPEKIEEAQDISIRAFNALGCYDASRVDLRMDADGNLYILEINSLPSLGEHGSYTIAAREAGMDFPALINQLVESASARYFGTPRPPEPGGRKKRDVKTEIGYFLTQRRDQIEKSLEEWVAVSSRTYDPVGNRTMIEKIDHLARELKMNPVQDVTDQRSAWLWESRAGFQGGTLLVGHIDLPLEANVPRILFRREPEYLYGEGIGASRAPLVMIEYALKALRAYKVLAKTPLGLMLYLDEGRDCRYSANLIKTAAGQAARVLVLRPGNPEDKIIIQRRGQRKLRFQVEGAPRRLGKTGRRPDVLLWTCEKLKEIAAISSRKGRVALSPVDLNTESFPLLLPHRVTVDLLLSYLDAKAAVQAEEQVRVILGKGGPKWEIQLISERPPMKERKHNLNLVRDLAETAREWDVSISQESSLWPSAAGLVPAKIPVVCGLGPVATDLYTPQERVSRVSLIQRTLLMAQFLHACGIKG